MPLSMVTNIFRRRKTYDLAIFSFISFIFFFFENLKNICIKDKIKGFKSRSTRKSGRAGYIDVPDFAQSNFFG